MFRSPGTQIKIEYLDSSADVKDKSYEISSDVNNADFKLLAAAMRPLYRSVQNIYRVNEINETDLQ